MTSVEDDRLARAIHGLNGGIVGREQPVVEDAIVFETRVVQHDEIRALADGERLAVERHLEQTAAGGTLGFTQYVALAVEQTLAVFERAKLIGGGDTYVGV